MGDPEGKNKKKKEKQKVKKKSEKKKEKEKKVLKNLSHDYFFCPWSAMLMYNIIGEAN